MAGTYGAVVKGTYGVLPRGFPWILLVWYAVVAALFGLEAGSGPMFRVVLPAVIVAAGIAASYLVQQRKAAAFLADAQGILLGARWKEPWRDRRKRAQIRWSQIQEIRISPAPAGSAVDIVLSGLAPHPTVRPAATAWALALLPTATFLQRPAILEPRADPVRYHAPLFGVGSSEVAAALRTLAPPSVPVTETSSSLPASAKEPGPQPAEHERR
jgi:hypothetical protein